MLEEKEMGQGKEEQIIKFKNTGNPGILKRFIDFKNKTICGVCKAKNIRKQFDKLKDLC